LAAGFTKRNGRSDGDAVTSDMDVTEEVFDICDADDRVVGTAPRSRVHANRWLHRAVHVFVFNSRGELLLQRRSATKDESPLKLTSSASGHLASGEDYEPGAIRELMEELGLQSPLEFVVKIPASPSMSYEHTVLYRTTTDEEPTPDVGEISGLEFASLSEIRRRLKDDPWDFSGPFFVLLEWYFAMLKNGGSPRT
jgi:isopentenyl-diphosphate Delta-isomerase